MVLKCIPEHKRSGRGVRATHSDADFAKDLLWDFACFLQWLVQRATILQAFEKKTTTKNSLLSYQMKPYMNIHEIQSVKMIEWML